MRIPLLGGSNSSALRENGEASNVNCYTAKDDGGEHVAILRPIKGMVGTSVTATSGVSVFGGGAVINRDYYLHVGKDVFKNGTRTVTNFFSAGEGSIWYTGTAQQYNQALLTNQNGAARGIYSFEYDTMWLFQESTLYTATPTNTNANQLIDTGRDFTTDPLFVVGMTVENTTAGTYATVTSIATTTNPNDTLNLSADIFPNTTDTYTIKYHYNVPTGTIKDATFLDGYFIIAIGNKFYISSLNNACVWNELDFATAGYDVDDIKALVAHKGNLWVIGATSTEIWYNSGNPDFPFEPMQSGYTNIGTEWPASVHKIGDEFCMVSTTHSGRVQVVMSTGLSYKPISTTNITNKIQNPWLEVDAIRAFSYSIGENSFYCLYLRPDTTSPTSDFPITLCYDLATGEWHEEENDISFALTVFDQNLGEFITYGTKFGDSSYIYESKPIFWDGGSGSEVANTMTHKTPTLHGEGKPIIYNSVQIDTSQVLPVCSEYIGPTVGITDYYGHDFDSVSITLNTDKVYFPDLDESTGVITAVSGADLTCASVPSNFINNTYYKYYIVDGDGNRKWPLGEVSLRWKDENGAWTTAQTRTQTGISDRLIWRKLGRARKRTFELSVTGPEPVVILGMYAEISTGTDDI